MESGRFGPPIGSSASGDDRFGYFGGSASPGSAMGQPTVSPFGGPAPAANPTQGAPQSSFGGPASTTSSTGSAFVPPPSKHRGWLPLAVAALLVAVVAAGVWWWLHRDTIVIPDHLGSLALSSDLHMPNGQLNTQTPSGAVTTKLAAYGMPARTGLVVSRGLGVSANLSGIASATAGLSHFGPVTCASGAGFVICLRAEGDLSVVVQTSSSVATPAQVADFVQQAWAAQ